MPWNKDGSFIMPSKKLVDALEATLKTSGIFKMFSREMPGKERSLAMDLAEVAETLQGPRAQESLSRPPKAIVITLEYTLELNTTTAQHFHSFMSVLSDAVRITDVTVRREKEVKE